MICSVIRTVEIRPADKTLVEQPGSVYMLSAPSQAASCPLTSFSASRVWLDPLREEKRCRRETDLTFTYIIANAL
jgi:hypothetical protein